MTRIRNEALQDLLYRARLDGSDLRIEFDPSKGYRVVEVVGTATHERSRWGDRWDVSIYLQGRVDAIKEAK